MGLGVGRLWRLATARTVGLALGPVPPSPLAPAPGAEAQARRGRKIMTYFHTMHEFLEHYDILHQTTRPEAAISWHDRNGGGLWHIDARGMVRPGAPVGQAVAFLVARRK